MDANRGGPCIVVLGRQGSGKGVQSARLAERCGLDHVSTGDCLREAIALGTGLGAAAAPYVERGELVPDDLVTGIVAERLARGSVEGHGVVLDGFPRTVDQAERLLELLGRQVDLAVHLDVPRSLAVGRLLERGRHDDTPATIGRRMSEHAKEEGPLRAWFEAAGVLVQVDGVGDPQDVADRVWRAVSEAGVAEPPGVAAAS